MTCPALPALLAVLSLCLLAYTDIRGEQATLALKARHAAELVTLHDELARYRPKPSGPSCSTYPVHMSLMTITHCVKPGVRM